MKIKLEHPIKKTSMMGIGDVTIDEIELRRPSINDLFGLDFNGPNQARSFALLISRLSGLSPSMVSKIDMKDYITISEWFNKVCGK